MIMRNEACKDLGGGVWAEGTACVNLYGGMELAGSEELRESQCGLSIVERSVCESQGRGSLCQGE